MKSMQKEKGFTIIEVVLVLAIAGLIFLIVFLAVPALQRGQRDSARKNDVGRVIGAIQDWKANHRGKLPADTAAMNAAFKSTITTNSSFTDPSGGDYVFVTAWTAGKNNTVNGELKYSPGNVCDATTNDLTTTGAGTNSFAVVMQLESGDKFCQSN